MRFEIDGLRIIPYVRMTQAGKWVKPRAMQYIARQDELAWELAATMRANDWSPFDRTPLVVTIEITMPSRLHRQDLDNQEKAIIDAAQGIVYGNDLWIDEKHSRRLLGDEWKITLEVEELEG